MAGVGKQKACVSFISQTGTLGRDPRIIWDGRWVAKDGGVPAYGSQGGGALRAPQELSFLAELESILSVALLCFGSQG